MAVNRTKYANLPDLDEAPDIYQTPALTDDNSTVRTATLPTTSPSASDIDDVSDEERISRRRINQDEARTRFEPSHVDARGVDFSDRLGSEHRSYRTNIRTRRRRSRGGTAEWGDFSEEEDEPIQMRLARLRREAEELRQQVEEDGLDGTDDQEDSADSAVRDGVKELSSILEGIHASSRGTRSAEDRLLQSLSAKRDVPKSTGPPSEQANGLQSSNAEDPSVLSTAAGLSDRLAALETSLGLTATTHSPALLPTLTSLASQIHTLSTTLAPASESIPGSTQDQLNQMSDRIRTLISESERLTNARKAATAAAVDLGNARAAAAATLTHADHSAAEEKVAAASATANANLSLSILDDQTAKIRSLYQTLPTITSLHPILPLVLERLRSLSVIHAGAAQASADLDEVENRQGALDDEIRKWREGLERVEAKMHEGEEVMKGNVEVVGARLRDVEERVKALNS